MSLPSTYNIDFSGLTQDLPTRGASRFLCQFYQAPVLNAILNAFSQEIQVLSDAINATIQNATLPYSAGVAMDSIGAILGQPRTDVMINTTELYMQDGTGDILMEDGVSDIMVDTLGYTQQIGDDEYRPLLLLRTLRNTNIDSSIPGLVVDILTATGVTAIFQLTGPMQVQVLIPSTTSSENLEYIRRKTTSNKTDDSWLFPFPATLDLTVVYNDGIEITTESNVPILLETSIPFIFENVEFSYL